MTHHRLDRRQFVGTLAVAGAALAGGSKMAHAEARPAIGPAGPTDWDHSWLKKLNTKHRAFFDTRTYTTDVFGYPARFRAAMIDGYGAKPGDIQIVVGLHGTAWAAAIDDARWASLGIGAHANIDDPLTKAKSVRNTIRTAPPEQTTAATLESAQRDGAIVLVCNNTLRRNSRELAAKRDGASADAIYAELRAGVLPGVIVVPAMIAATGLAQERGASYLSAG